ncbi:MAG: Rieske 2Fe-2S domain-containing protein [Porticoccaceae bacterium]
MKKHNDNTILTEVEPGTPMHQAMSRYWLPVLPAEDVPQAAAAPVRVTLLSEDLVVFRTASGELGLLADACCHRRASLSLGRVDEQGIRCLFHGWKFAPDGTVLEQPNVDPGSKAPDYCQPSYPVREAGGIIWGYLGPKDKIPPFPKFPFFDVPDSQRRIFAPEYPCNYAQLLEGTLDSAHIGILHSDAFPKGKEGVSGGAFLGEALVPRLEVESKSWGFRYAALREVNSASGEVVTQARISSFIFPCLSMVAGDSFRWAAGEGDLAAADNAILAAVPISTQKTRLFQIAWTHSPDAIDKLDEFVRINGFIKKLPEDGNLANRFGQDRESMRSGASFSGFETILLEDRAVLTSLGEVNSREGENLVPSDAAVVRLRRRLIDNARAVAEGKEAGGAMMEQPVSSGEMIVTREKPWQSFFKD